MFVCVSLITSTLTALALIEPEVFPWREGQTVWVPSGSEAATLAGKVFTRLSRAWAAEWDLRMTRNLVVGPLSEEWVFRACMCPLIGKPNVGHRSTSFVNIQRQGGRAPLVTFELPVATLPI